MAPIRISTVDVSARKTYDLIAEPVDDDYRALINGSLMQCDLAILTVPSGEVPSGVSAVLEQLQPFARGEPVAGPGGNLHRYRLDRESAAIFRTAVSALYGWCGPTMPADLCLMRTDGSPWLVSIASERLGYLELTPFEKLLLARGSPAMGHILAHQGAKDAVLAVFERAFEASVDHLHDGIRSYARMVVGESRDSLVDTLRDWLESDEQARMTVAIDVAAEFGLGELAADIAGMRAAIAADKELAPHVYEHNPVLRDRWRARYIRQLDRALAILSPKPPRPNVSGAGAATTTPAPLD